MEGEPGGSPPRDDAIWRQRADGAVEFRTAEDAWEPYRPSPWAEEARSWAARVPTQWCRVCGEGLVASAIVCSRCGASVRVTHHKRTAVLLAVFLSFWTWLYTWHLDRSKFIVGLFLGVLGSLSGAHLEFLVLALVGVWIWAIVDTVRRPASWYERYP